MSSEECARHELDATNGCPACELEEQGWAAFAAGAYCSGSPVVDPDREWQELTSRLQALRKEGLPPLDWQALRVASATWAAGYLPPRILLARRWF